MVGFLCANYFVMIKLGFNTNFTVLATLENEKNKISNVPFICMGGLVERVTSRLYVIFLSMLQTKILLILYNIQWFDGQPPFHHSATMHFLGTHDTVANFLQEKYTFWHDFHSDWPIKGELWRKTIFKEEKDWAKTKTPFRIVFDFWF